MADTKKAALPGGPSQNITRPQSTQPTPAKPITPREHRIVGKLLEAPLSAREVRTHGPCNNAPDLIARLRRKCGLVIPCAWVSFVTVDGAKSRFGIYSLTDADRKKLLPADG
jgi:hypothetical protein